MDTKGQAAARIDAGEGGVGVSKLYDMKVRIDQKIASDKLDANEIKGKLGLRCGTLLAFITASTVDNPETVMKLKQAAKEILQLSL
jgi:hypothetical protein